MSSLSGPALEYICDRKRHLICRPYSVANLHRMAAALRLGRHWFHNKPGRAHYDIPRLRIAEITSYCQVITSRDLLKIITNSSPLS